MTRAIAPGSRARCSGSGTLPEREALNSLQGPGLMVFMGASWQVHLSCYNRHPGRSGTSRSLLKRVHVLPLRGPTLDRGVHCRTDHAALETARPVGIEADRRAARGQEPGPVPAMARAHLRLRLSLWLEALAAFRTNQSADSLRLTCFVATRRCGVFCCPHSVMCVMYCIHGKQEARPDGRTCLCDAGASCRGIY
jgi:hypothetical protein